MVSMFMVTVMVNDGNDGNDGSIDDEKSASAISHRPSAICHLPSVICDEGERRGVKGGRGGRGGVRGEGGRDGGMMG